MAINWGELGKQLTDWGGDYDIFSDYSREGGVRDQAGAKGITGGGAQGKNKPGYDSTGRKITTNNNSSNNNKQQSAPVITVANSGVSGGGGGGTNAAAAQAAREAAERGNLLREIQGMSPAAQALFGEIFERITWEHLITQDRNQISLIKSSLNTMRPIKSRSRHRKT